MCNRYYNETTVEPLQRMLGDLVEVRDAARRRPHKPDQRPTDEVLIIVKEQGRLSLSTARWGFPPRHAGGELVLNARTESLDTVWRSCTPCWMPTTGWIEYLEGPMARTTHMVALRDRSLFLLAGVCGFHVGERRVAMCTEDAIPRLAHLCDRLPIPYAIEALEAHEPESIIHQMVPRPQTSVA